MNKISDECNKRKSSEVHIEDRGGEKHYKSSDGMWLLLQGPKKADDWDPQDFLTLLLLKRDADDYAVAHRDRSGCVEMKFIPTTWKAMTMALNSKQEIAYNILITCLKSFEIKFNP